MANEAIHARMVGKGCNQDSYPSACGSRFRPCPYCLLARLHDIFPPAAFKTQVILQHAFTPSGAIPQHAIPDRSCGECITDDATGSLCVEPRPKRVSHQPHT